MRWERLFDDLEAQLAAQERLERDAEVADRTRAERARITLADRLAAHRGQSLSCALLGGGWVEGSLTDLGDGWLLLDIGTARQCLVLLPAVVGVTSLSRRSRPDASARRFGVGYALRGVSRDRAAVRMTLIDGSHVEGTVDHVGADHVDVSEHALDEARRHGNVRSVRTIPVAALAAVTSAG